MDRRHIRLELSILGAVLGIQRCVLSILIVSLVYNILHCALWLVCNWCWAKVLHHVLGNRLIV